MQFTDYIPAKLHTSNCSFGAFHSRERERERERETEREPEPEPRLGISLGLP
ncbi:predicted protein [Plenodomus lingam JN3]|uniref:Predicted protein n=1 Tax=Leptosphaeria maculans (strain JN3 / isolate v23.1.3 / race Av1-4-5-6-7-8) TaxID=985895 RepID=E4ZLG1_LEPMJ|nr:predicted protein [Plenodomus lingam JN3]CBX92320.1 predicted protein [Plenodomus lingam JN3]